MQQSMRKEEVKASDYLYCGSYTCVSMRRDVYYCCSMYSCESLMPCINLVIAYRIDCTIMQQLIVTPDVTPLGFAFGGRDAS